MKSVTVVEEGGLSRYMIAKSIEDYYADFVVFRCTSWDEEDNPVDMVNVLSARIKWDGCCDIEFTNQCMHLCELEEMEWMTQAMNEMYRIAESEIPHWNNL